jgi:hypothetical protein
MGCGDNEPAFPEMAVHEGGEQFLGGVIQPYAGLIEQPDWTGDKRQSCKCQAAPLAGGEKCRGIVCKWREIDSLQGAHEIAAAEEVAPENQILRDSESGFAGITVGYVMCLLARSEIWRAAFERNFAVAGFAEVCKQAEQR